MENCDFLKELKWNDPIVRTQRQVCQNEVDSEYGEGNWNSMSLKDQVLFVRAVQEQIDVKDLEDNLQDIINDLEQEEENQKVLIEEE